MKYIAVLIAGDLVASGKGNTDHDAVLAALDTDEGKVMMANNLNPKLGVGHIYGKDDVHLSYSTTYRKYLVDTQ